MVTLVFDIETLKAIPKSNRNEKNLGFGCGVIYNVDNGIYYKFYPESVKPFVDMLSSADKLVSYNGIHFDIPVLNFLMTEEQKMKLEKVEHQDLFKDIMKATKSFIGLKNVAEFTLVEGGKPIVQWTDESALAPQMIAEGKIEEVLEHCVLDVKATYLLWKHIQDKRTISYFNKKTKQIKTQLM